MFLSFEGGRKYPSPIPSSKRKTFDNARNSPVVVNVYEVNPKLQNFGWNNAWELLHGHQREKKQQYWLKWCIQWSYMGLLPRPRPCCAFFCFSSCLTHVVHGVSYTRDKSSQNANLMHIHVDLLGVAMLIVPVVLHHLVEFSQGELAVVVLVNAGEHCVHLESKVQLHFWHVSNIWQYMTIFIREACNRFCFRED